MVPIPEPKLFKKFAYFYEPYNYNCNTKKFMTFDDETEQQNQRPKSSVGSAPTYHSKNSWGQVHDFIHKNDERVYVFVVNQLRRKLGKREPIKKTKLRKTTQEIENKKERIN